MLADDPGMSISFLREAGKRFDRCGNIRTGGRYSGFEITVKPWEITSIPSR